MKGMTWKTAGIVFALASAAGIVIGEEPVSVSKNPLVVEKPEFSVEHHGKEMKSEPWLGIDVSKPERVVYAQLKGVPPGVGFVINEVATGSPAEAAGLREYDFVWKMDDQMLINRSQFWTLLSLQKEGAEVTVTIQRGGEDEEVILKVGRRPDDQKGRARADVRVMSPGIPGLPTLNRDFLRKEAELRDDEGTVRIWRQGEGYGWAQFDEFDLEIASGTLSGLSEEAFPPKMDSTLQAKLKALIRGYEQADRNRARSGPLPRVRRVPTKESPR